MEKSINTLQFWKNSPFLGFVYSVFWILIGVTQLSCTLHLEAQSIEESQERLSVLHSKLQLKYGSFEEEYPEQLMAAMYIPKEAKVLELGGNIGRNSCIIASLLENQKNLVVLEPCLQYAQQLRENRDLNGLEFIVEAAAISKVKLIQSGWKTIPSEVVLPGYASVKTISFSELQQKHQIEFDTLVVDCEGALYNILLDDPNILKNIKLVIIENDFDEFYQMAIVQEFFKENGLQCVYNQAYTASWRVCGESFFQVWQK